MKNENQTEEEKQWEKKYREEKYWMDEMDKELSKSPFEINMDYIDECQRHLDEINGDKFLPDPEKKAKALAELEETFVRVERIQRPIRALRAILATLCAVLFVVCMPAIVIAELTDSTPIGVIMRYGTKILTLPYERLFEVNGISFVRNGDLVKYDSIESLLNEENFDILYPTWLPEDTKVEKLILVEDSAGTEIQFVFNNEEMYYKVMLYDYYGDSIYSLSDDTFDYNGETYYLTSVFGQTKAVLVHDKFSYSITTTDRETLINIIKGLKKV